MLIRHGARLLVIIIRTCRHVVAHDFKVLSPLSRLSPVACIWTGKLPGVGYPPRGLPIAQSHGTPIGPIWSSASAYLRGIQTPTLGPMTQCIGIQGREYYMSCTKLGAPINHKLFASTCFSLFFPENDVLRAGGTTAENSSRPGSYHCRLQNTEDGLT